MKREFSNEHRENIRLAAIGNKNGLGHKVTEAHRHKLSIAHKGKPLSENHKKKLSEKKKGIPLSDAHKKNISISNSGERSHLWKGGISKNKTYMSWLKNKRNRAKRQLNDLGSKHSFGDWETLKAQYNWTCPICKKSEPTITLTEDHIIPISKGGSDNIENIQPLCRSCNSRKSNKL